MREGKAVVMLLCFVVVAGVVAAVLLLEFDFNKESDQLTEMVTVNNEPVSGELILERVDMYRKGDVELATITSMPPEIAIMLREQSDFFHSVIQASEILNNRGLTNEQEASWKKLQENFPDKTYYSRPSRGKYEVGTREYIRERHGNSNAMTMSHALHGSFLDIIAKADPFFLDKVIAQMEAKTDEEIKNRDLKSIEKRARDSHTLPRAHADRVWLELLKEYTDEIKAARSEFPKGKGMSHEDHQKHLASWEAFNDKNSKMLANWYERNTLNRQQYDNSSLRFATDGYPIVKIAFGGHFLYITPETTPQEIIFRINP